MKPVVGLTGGIGSGKSAAADEFARLGATVEWREGSWYAALGWYSTGSDSA